MKLLHKMPLRMRVTLLTGVMVLLTSLVLTAASMKNANGQIGELKRAMEVSVKSSEVTADEAQSVSISAKAMPLEQGIEPPVATMTAVYTVAAKVEQRFNYWSLFALVLVAGAGMSLSYYVAGRALAPVRQLSQAASEINAHNLQTRLPICETADEIGGLTRAFNGMLDRLQDSFEGQQRFSSNVAHELKTPLATMKLCVQTARLEQEGEAEFLNVTERSVDRLTDVVNDLLLLTNDGAEDMHDEILLPEMLHGIIDELTPLYEKKRIEITFDLPKEGAAICANRGLVRHIFYNLIENGLKYNKTEGTLCIRVSEEPNETRVSITDSGSGIPEDKQAHIFEPFYCVDPSRSRKLGGAGLGLSIAKAIADKHSWMIEIESAPEAGATFSVVIPRG